MLKYEVMAVNGVWRMKEGIKEAAHSFFTDESGDTNLISIVVVLVIVMALAIVFRKNITDLLTQMWKKIFDDAQNATGIGGSATEFK